MFVLQVNTWQISKLIESSSGSFCTRSVVLSVKTLNSFPCVKLKISQIHDYLPGKSKDKFTIALFYLKIDLNLQIVVINPLNQIPNFKCVQNIHILDKMGLAKQWSAFCLWRKVFIAFEKSSWLFIVLSLYSKYLFEMWWVSNLA